jgi:hypothetical protein
LCNYRYTRAAGEAKTKIRVFSYSNVGVRRARDIGAAALFSSAAAIFIGLQQKTKNPETARERSPG